MKHTARYYTDYVFPVLYGKCGAEDSYIMMNRLKDRLTYFSDETGERLMRVGEFKPSMFGNDNVMPTQAAEAARAFFAIGDLKTGLELLQGIARGVLSFTEQPGSFPERMDDAGKGEYNYMFSNPSASYIYTYISGLFGIRRKDGGKVLQINCAFPENTSKACLKLPYAEIAFKGDPRSCFLKIKTKARKILLSGFFPADSQITANTDGVCVHTIFAEPAVNSKKYVLELIPEKEEFSLLLRVTVKGHTKIIPEQIFYDEEKEYVEYRLKGKADKISFIAPAIMTPRINVQLQCRYENGYSLGGWVKINDPQLLGCTLKVKVMGMGKEFCFTEKLEKPGTIFLKKRRFYRIPLRVLQVVYALERKAEHIFEKAEDLPVLFEDYIAEEKLEKNTVHCNIDSVLNKECMSVKTAWRNAEDYPIKPVPGPQKNRIRTAAGSFKVKQAKNALQGCICAAIAERGFLNRETQQIEYEKKTIL